MRQKRKSEQSPSERVVRNIQRKTRKHTGLVMILRRCWIVYCLIFLLLFKIDCPRPK